jgi:hypothetical protein
MVTILRQHGFRFVIYINDHEPAHVHVLGNGEAKIEIGENAEIIWSQHFKIGELRKAKNVVKLNHAEFLKRWNEIHDGIDPDGI